MTLLGQKTLTVKLDLDLMVEFAVAVRILRGRSVSSFVHQFIVNQVNNAREMVDPVEYLRMVEEQKEATRERSEIHSSRLAPFGKQKTPGKIASEKYLKGRAIDLEKIRAPEKKRKTG